MKSQKKWNLQKKKKNNNKKNNEIARKMKSQEKKKKSKKISKLKNFRTQKILGSDNVSVR